MRGGVCGSQRTVFGSHFSPSTMPFQGAEFRLAGLAASSCTCWADSPAPSMTILPPGLMALFFSQAAIQNLTKDIQHPRPGVSGYSADCVRVTVVKETGNKVGC